jgi:hypothetical protein
MFTSVLSVVTPRICLNPVCHFSTFAAEVSLLLMPFMIVSSAVMFWKTAVGKYPIETVQHMKRIFEEAEDISNIVSFSSIV